GVRITLLASACMSRGFAFGQLPAGIAILGLALKLAPDVAELEKPRFPRQPLGGAHSAFRESLARLGVVAQVDTIASRIEDHLMHTDRVAFAKRDDLD